MKTRLSLLTLVLCAVVSVPAMALNVVNVNAPAVNYVFSTGGTIYVTDMSSSVLGSGFVQSRIFQGQSGTQAAGLWCYEYRIDLRQVAGITYPPSIDRMYFDFGPVSSLDYNGDHVYTDQAFVITSGGIGNVAPSSVFQFWGSTFLDFSPAIYAGSYPGGGDSSYFIGLVSPYPPRVVNASVHTDTGYVTVSVYAPNHP